MTIKTLPSLCAVVLSLSLQAHAQENTRTQPAEATPPAPVTQADEIKKYEVRGIMEIEEPSVSLYYDGQPLGWLKPGQKKGNCLLKAYQKETKTAVVEINGKEYALKTTAMRSSGTTEASQPTLLLGDVLEISNTVPGKVYSAKEFHEVINRFEGNLDKQTLVFNGPFLYSDPPDSAPVDLSSKQVIITKGGQDGHTFTLMQISDKDVEARVGVADFSQMKSANDTEILPPKIMTRTMHETREADR